MSQWVIDASLTLGWFLQDEQDRQYSLGVLTSYDAAYLELAIRLKLPMASNDKALLRAAAACGVPRVQP